MLSVVIVAYRSEAALAVTLPALAAELRDGDELIVVDNGSTDGSAELAREFGQVIENPENAGFPAACNQGAAAARGELLVFLNPDAVPQAGWGDAIRRPLEGPWTAWQGMVMSGDEINSSGTAVHFTGVAWAGSELGALSGACLAVRRAEFEAVGGFAEPYFLYHEDVDLSLRLRLAGGRLGLAADAVVDHDYEFEKGDYKWRLLERNRWWTLLRCWPGPLLAVVAPALLLTELAIWAVALRGGWAREKAQATSETARALPRLLRERRAIQGRRRIGAAEFAASLTPELSSPFLGPAAQSRALQAGLAAYWRIVLAALGER